jgi:E-phenylitaconyl-CoA hydratase
VSSADETSSGVEAERLGAVLVVRLQREHAANALDPASMMQLRLTLEDFRDDPTLSVAIITGVGTRFFCAGSDLKQTPPAGAPFATALLGPWEHGVADGGYVRAITLSEINIGKPLIAAINGHAAGGGLEIALDCDVRIASTNATFSLPEARWASVPAVGGLSRLLRAVPAAVAMKMVLTGERVDATEAHRIGLISDLYESDQLLDAALDLARRIAANGPLAVRAICRLARDSYDLPLSQAIALEQAYWGLLRDTEDRTEGRRAFAEHRDPNYRGQ